MHNTCVPVIVKCHKVLIIFFRAKKAYFSACLSMNISDALFVVLITVSRKKKSLLICEFSKTAVVLLGRISFLVLISVQAWMGVFLSTQQKLQWRLASSSSLKVWSCSWHGLCMWKSWCVMIAVYSGSLFNHAMSDHWWGRDCTNLTTGISFFLRVSLVLL